MKNEITLTVGMTVVGKEKYSNNSIYENTTMNTVLLVQKALSAAVGGIIDTQIAGELPKSIEPKEGQTFDMEVYCTVDGVEDFDVRMKYTATTMSTVVLVQKALHEAQGALIQGQLAS